MSGPSAFRFVSSAIALTTVVACASVALMTPAIRSGTQFAVSGNTTDLFFDMQGIIWRLQGTGGEAVALSAATDDLRRPTVSPDGKWIAAQSFATGAWDIVVLRTDGSEQRNLTNSMTDDQEPAWSADGSRLLFSSDRTGNEDIWSVDVNTGALTQLTTDQADDFAPAALDDGLIYISTRSGKTALYEQRWAAEDEKIQQAPLLLTEAPAGRLATPRLSPDKAMLAWVQARERNGFPGVARNEVVTLNRANGEQQVISTPDQDVFEAAPHWGSNDTLLYSADGKIIKVNITEQQASPIEFSARLPLKRNRFTPKLPIAFRDGPQPLLGIVDPIMLTDNSIVFTALNDLWRLTETGALLQLTNDIWVERDVTTTADGKSLAFISDRDGSMQIWQLELSTNAMSRVTSKANGPRYPSYSPNGKYLAYQQAGPIGVQDFTVRLINLATGENTKLRSSPKIWPGRMAWSTDNKHLIVAELARTSGRASDGRNQLVRINVRADVAGKTDLPAGVTADAGPVSSPDGKQLALIIDGALWVLPLTQGGLAGGEPQLLLDDLVESPAWSADGRALLVLTNNGMEVIDASTAARSVRPLDKTWLPALGDGPWLIHAGKLWEGSGNDYRRDVDVFIEGNRIAAVKPHSDHGNARVLDASQHTVLPGLIDHHVHFEADEGEWVGRALLAFGVTTVVEPGGLPYESREHMESWRSGKRLGPRLVYAGTQLDGHRRTFNFASHIETEQRLRRELERAQHLDYGLIKTYRRLKPELQALAVTLAHQQGLPVTAHAALRNAGNGGDRTEHLRGSGRLSFSSKQSDLLLSYSDVQSIYSATATQLTPTLVNQGGFLDFARQTDLNLVKNYTAIYPENSRNGVSSLIRFASRNQALINTGLRNAQRTLVQLHAGGVEILAGTDSPIFPYGLALVAELKNYVDGGMKPADALRTATVNPAAALGGAKQIGQLRPGMLADIVVVSGDPLADVSDLTRVEHVILNGRHIPIEELTDAL